MIKIKNSPPGLITDDLCRRWTTLLLRWLAGPSQKWYDMGNTRYGDSLLDCQAIDAIIVYGYKAINCKIFNWKSSIIILKSMGNFVFVVKNELKMVAILQIMQHCIH